MIADEHDGLVESHLLTVVYLNSVRFSDSYHFCDLSGSALEGSER
jgi:hypothetical protein